MKDDLRSILRKGDPAAGEPGLTPEEVRGMRRAVLSAVPEPRRRGWLVPVLAGAAALIVAVALILWQPESEVVTAAVRPPVVRPPLPLAGEGRGEGAVQAEKTPPLPSPALQERGPEREREKKPEPEPIVIAQAETPPTQIQFSTPGGTRIIWMLHPATE